MTAARFWALRDAVPADAGYVVRTWLDSLEPHSAAARACKGDYLKLTNRRLGGILHDAFFVHQQPLVQELVSRARVLIAAHTAEPDVVLGWACGEVHSSGPPVIHYVYVRGRYRRSGIASSLVDDLLLSLRKLDAARGTQVLVSQLTPMAKTAVERRRWVHVPVVAFTRREGRSAA